MTVINVVHRRGATKLVPRTGANVILLILFMLIIVGAVVSIGVLFLIPLSPAETLSRSVDYLNQKYALNLPEKWLLVVTKQMEISSPTLDPNASGNIRQDTLYVYVPENETPNMINHILVVAVRSNSNSRHTQLSITSSPVTLADITAIRNFDIKSKYSLEVDRFQIRDVSS